MAFSFDAGVGGRKRDEDEEKKAPSGGVLNVNPGGSGTITKSESVYNEGGRRVGDLDTVAPRREEEDQPLSYEAGVSRKEEEEPALSYSGEERAERNAPPEPVPAPEPEEPSKPETSEAPKKEEKTLVFVPPANNGGTSGGGTNAAGTKAELTGIPKGSDTWTPEQWREYMNQPGNREAMADVTKKTADAAREALAREQKERGGADRAERNQPQAPKAPAPTGGGQPAYAWQGIRAGDQNALNDLMNGAPAPAPVPAPSAPRRSGEERAEQNQPQNPQREPDSVRMAREAAARRNAPPAPQPAAQRRSGEERAEQNRPVGSFQPKVGTQPWLEDNGLSWAGQPNQGGTPMTMPDVTADYPGGGGYDAMLEDGIRIRMSRGESREDAERHTREDIARQNLAAAADQAGSGTPGVIRYEPTAKTEAERAQEAEAQSILTQTTAAGEKNAVRLAQENGVDPSVLNDPGFLRAFKGYRDQNWNVQAAFMTALAGYDAKVQDETRALKNEYVNEAIEKSGVDPREMTRDQYDRIERDAEARAEKDYTEQTGKRYQEPRRNGEERAEQGMSYNPPATPPATGGTPATTSGAPESRENSSPNNPNRPGANAEVNSWDGNAGQREPDSVRFAREAAERRNAGTQTQSGTGSSGSGGSGNNLEAGVSKDKGTGSGTGTGTGSGSGGKGSDVPKGSTYFTPSYGQDMEKGVKAPYRKGGYTAEEIEKMGNKARSDWKYYNGNKAYEGYYLAPDGKYYPVDQVKANYYRQNGSYNGWDEGMRDYWNTFGTFYGYRPGWRTTGRLGGGGGGSYSSSRSYSYSGGGGSRSGGSGGSSSAANSGYYWNGNTSWSI